MYRTACPSCGAEVRFRSTASVMAVCEYCQSTLLRDADSVENIGKMSAVLEDYSPLQIGTSGRWQGEAFTLVGRIQLRYAAGFWNEWYALFDDGSEAWLSDASGQFVFTRVVKNAPTAPDFSLLHPGTGFRYGGKRYVATDVRTAACTGGQGELPFQVGPGWEAKVADFRHEDEFLTLDYSGGEPVLYAGSAVTLEDLQCQLLRDADAIGASAGKLPGTAVSLSCPGCGAAIEYRHAVAEHLVCAACSSEVAVEDGQARALRVHREQDQQPVRPTLALGSKGKVDGGEWEVIGFLRCREVGEPDEWNEYLLFNATRGFLWLSESEDGWEKIHVLNQLPGGDLNAAPSYKGVLYKPQFDYEREVIHAAGAFNWRVSVGDTARIRSFVQGQRVLYSETTREEVTWSLGVKFSRASIMAWFGSVPAGTGSGAPAPGRPIGEMSVQEISAMLTVLLVVINLPAALIALIQGQFFASAIVFAIGMFVLWLPQIIIGKLDG